MGIIIQRVEPIVAFQTEVARIIADSPTVITRTREVAVDTFKPPVVYSQGPYSVRIELATMTARGETWDREGQTVRLIYNLLGVDLPRTVTEGGVIQPLFKTGDKLTTAAGEVYYVASAPITKGTTIQLILEQRG